MYNLIIFLKKIYVCLLFNIYNIWNWVEIIATSLLQYSCFLLPSYFRFRNKQYIVEFEYICISTNIYSVMYNNMYYRATCFVKMALTNSSLYNNTHNYTFIVMLYIVYIPVGGIGKVFSSNSFIIFKFSSHILKYVHIILWKI